MIILIIPVESNQYTLLAHESDTLFLKLYPHEMFVYLEVFHSEI